MREWIVWSLSIDLKRVSAGLILEQKFVVALQTTCFQYLVVQTKNTEDQRRQSLSFWNKTDVTIEDQSLFHFPHNTLPCRCYRALYTKWIKLLFVNIQ